MKLIVFKLRYHVVYENGIRGGQSEMTVAASTATEAEQLVKDEAILEDKVTEVQVLSSETIATDVIIKSAAALVRQLTEGRLKAEYDKGYADGIDFVASGTKDTNVTSDAPQKTDDGSTPDPSVPATVGE